MTVRSVSALASWMAMEPTPPAPPMMRIAFAAPGTARFTSSRSNSISQAVMAVSGSAAASALDSDVRLGSDDALVDQVILRIGALPVERAGVEHRVARLEQLGIRSRRLDDACGVPAQHPPLAGRRLGPHAHLGVDRVHRYGLHLHKQVATGWRRLGQLDVDQRPVIGDRKRLLITDGLHGSAPALFQLAKCSKAARHMPRGLTFGKTRLTALRYAALSNSSLKPCASASVRMAFSASAAGSSVNGARTLAQPASCR